jgi:hypothetical protein
MHYRANQYRLHTALQPVDHGTNAHTSSSAVAAVSFRFKGLSTFRQNMKLSQALPALQGPSGSILAAVNGSGGRGESTFLPARGRTHRGHGGNDDSREKQPTVDGGDMELPRASPGVLQRVGEPMGKASGGDEKFFGNFHGTPGSTDASMGLGERE